MSTTGSELPARTQAVVVGAGLGGLSTAIRLRQLGLSVVVVERLSRVGGLCGTVQHQGKRYVVACNDFGRGVLGDLRELGVSHPFERCRTRLVHRGRAYSIPPDLSTLAKLVPHLPSLWRHVRGLAGARRSRYGELRFLDQLVDRCAIGGTAGDLLMLPAYLMGVSPDRFRLDALDDEFTHGYGYAAPVTPVGGPQALADALHARLAALGGTVLLDCEMTAVEDSAGGKTVHTSRGRTSTDILVSTLARPGHYPHGFEAGLPICALWLQIDSRYRLPRGIHTHVYYPPAIRGWFGDLYAGRLPDRFGFHFFCSDLGDQQGVRTANVYFYLPRGLEEDPAAQRAAERFVRAHLDELLPGITDSIRGSALVSPGAFRAQHGFEARVTPVIAPAGFAKPGNHCRDTDIYYAGAAAFPPGEHAGSAIRSSVYVRNLVAARLRRESHALA